MKKSLIALFSLVLVSFGYNSYASTHEGKLAVKNAAKIESASESTPIDKKMNQNSRYQRPAESHQKKLKMFQRQKK